MRTAIYTGQFYKSHETMINRHIMHLFGGNTCVICNTLTDEDRPDKPYINWREIRQKWHDKIFRKPKRIYDAQIYSTRDIPWGRQRRHLIRFLRAQQVEVILSEFGTQTVRMAPLAHELGIPIIGYFRGADATSELHKSNRIEAYKKMVPMVHGFIAVSQFLLDYMASHGICHPNSFVIPSGVDVRRFVPSEKKIKNRCIAVGRLIEKKAPLLTLRAFCDVAENRPEMTLEMIGGGEYIDECRSYVKMRGHSDRVFIRGTMSHEYVLEALKQAEIFLQHSVVASDGNAEGLPTAIQEAMACGLAVLSTRHAGIPDAVYEGDNGLLVDEFDIEGFRTQLGRMIRRDVDVERMMQRSRQIATERFDNAKLLEQTEETIRKLVGSGHP